MKQLREQIAKYLEKAVKDKKEIIFIPTRDRNCEYISWDSFLEMADAIIPMVKTDINKKNKKNETT